MVICDGFIFSYVYMLRLKFYKILNYLILLLQNAISWQLTALLPRNEALANYAGGDFLQILCEQCLVSMCNEKTAQGNLKMGQSEAARSLTDVPVEILLQILNQLNFMDLKSTESVSNYIR